MLDICLLGTAGMMPLPNRKLTSCIFRYNGSQILIDCGEGTQVALKKQSISPKPIDVILFTHYHADHISGLPGLLLTMGNAGRTEELTMVGPRRLREVVESLRIIAPELPFDIKYIELSEEVEELNLYGYRINAFKCVHRTDCYGYTLSIDRGGKFDPERARELEIPLKYWKVLQKGESVTEDGKTKLTDAFSQERISPNISASSCWLFNNRLSTTAKRTVKQENISGSGESNFRFKKK